ncbi:hypothetical protein Syun_028799 [Stephania yunnanensis]|uniref:Uncharacterized protein n=1 Tax=Stephania yunnanensis TaxID=152371 RepID=A0AAP0E6U0_9MAGN
METMALATGIRRSSSRAGAVAEAEQRRGEFDSVQVAGRTEQTRGQAETKIRRRTEQIRQRLTLTDSLVFSTTTKRCRLGNDQTTPKTTIQIPVTSPTSMKPPLPFDAEVQTAARRSGSGGEARIAGTATGGSGRREQAAAVLGCHGRWERQARAGGRSGAAAIAAGRRGMVTIWWADLVERLRRVAGGSGCSGGARAVTGRNLVAAGGRSGTGGESAQWRAVGSGAGRWEGSAEIGIRAAETVAKSRDCGGRLLRAAVKQVAVR